MRLPGGLPPAAAISETPGLAAVGARSGRVQSEVDCTVCLETVPFSDIAPCIFYVCGHYVCKRCFRRLMRTELHAKAKCHVCPTCRTPIIEDAGVWVAHNDPKGKTYFYNNKTGQRSFQRPPECAAHWEERKDQLGRRYYHNKLTNERSWTCPTDEGVSIAKL